ncbi:hypothetical protein BO99DRAFT_411309 [Aspergillus violaceofuscus CBS 115571]|uniref:Small EDRK-rich factor-like N-terminal domain-containing protein n=1 Tax=Aspergillus violaceofuscus (strain CBS 115571) TaxID=1450538 RepID=A0A2V5IAA9_ASPV1|nr:hypothetical protein BO99DRAFT_411309 [Aspergillus violaceofuscus CBS 115571]
MTRGNQRDRDRAKNNKEQSKKKSKNELTGTEFQRKKESDAAKMQAKQKAESSRFCPPSLSATSSPRSPGTEYLTIYPSQTMLFDTPVLAITIRVRAYFMSWSACEAQGYDRAHATISHGLGLFNVMETTVFDWKHVMRTW